MDLWKEHTPPPFNRMPDSYSFLVKNAFLWRFTYELTNPKLIHVPYLSTVGLFIRGSVHEALDKYQPDLVVGGGVGWRLVFDGGRQLLVSWRAWPTELRNGNSSRHRSPTPAVLL